MKKQGFIKLRYSIFVWVAAITLISSLIIFVTFHYIPPSIISFAHFYILMYYFDNFDYFTAICGDDFIADEKTRSFSTKDYFDSYPRDVDCWWNIKSQSADKLVCFWTGIPENVQVTIESPVCFYFSVGLCSFF